MNHTTPHPLPPGWLDAIEESDAQLAAGQVIPLLLVLADIQDTIAHIEAKLAAGATAPKVSPTPPKP